MTTKTIVITGTYSKCTATGGFGANITPAEYELSADESVSVLKGIVLTFPALGCSLKVDGGDGNTNLKTIKYLTDPLNSSAILAHVEVAGIHSLASGNPCGTGEATEGTYRGLFLAFIDGGSIRWT